jgi:NAD(P)-dependent dehydrogenase (short-subunit alcohol dehydrogenase family)
MKDKVVLVTGGSSGIGRAAALAFARKGAKMVIAARGAERGHRVAREIEAGGARALFVRADVSQAADVHGLVKNTVDCWGRGRAFRANCRFYRSAV